MMVLGQPAGDSATFVVPPAGIEPALPKERDFESYDPGGGTLMFQYLRTATRNYIATFKAALGHTLQAHA